MLLYSDVANVIKDNEEIDAFEVVVDDKQTAPESTQEVVLHILSWRGAIGVGENISWVGGHRTYFVDGVNNWVEDTAQH